MEKATFYLQDGTKEEFFLLMDTTLSGVTYVLASETDPDEGDEIDCLIFKKTGEDGSDAIYEPVEDDDELMAVHMVFVELLDEEGVDLV